MKRLLILALLVSVLFPLFSDDQWLQTETENFTFIYQEEDVPTLEEILTFAEPVYDDLTNLLGTTTPRVTVVVYGETDFANGFYNPNPPQHIGIYSVQPSGPWIGAGTENWLRYLFIHELTHFIQANHQPGLFYGLGTIFGRSISGLDIGFVPLWIIEGMAIHTESLYTGGGRQHDPLFELYYKALAIEDDLFTLAQAGYSSHLAPQGHRPYVAGAFIWRELELRYGPEYAAQFLDEYTRFPLFGMWRAVRRTTGVRMTTIYDSITNELIRRYAREASLPVDAQISPEVEGNYSLPSATARGLITYRYRPDERSGLVLFNNSENGERQLATVPASDRDAWDVTADGLTAVVATPTVEAHSALGSQAKSDLYLLALENNATRRLTENGGYYSPALDERGRYLVAVERVGNFQQLVWFDISADEAIPTVLFRLPRARFYYPDVSADAKRVLAAVNQEGHQQIAILSGPASAFPGELIGYVPRIDGAAPYKPRFDGSGAITFSAFVDGSLSLFRYDLSSESMTRIATDRVGIVGGFSEGADVVYQAYTSDGFVVRRAPAEAAAIAPTRLSVRPFLADEVTRERPIAFHSKPYRAVPTPRFWLPWVALHEPATGGPSLGVGALVSGADYLGRNSWQSELLYYPALRRPGYGFTYSWQRGRYRAQLSLQEEYIGNVGSTSSPLYVQRFDHALQFEVDLLSKFALGTANRVTTGLTLVHLADYAAESPFYHHDAFGGSVELATGLLAPGVSLAFQRSPQAPANAAVSPGSLGARGEVIRVFPLSSMSEQAFLFGLSAFANAPLGGSHVLRITPSARFATNAAYRNPFTFRGFSEETPLADESVGFYHLAVDYLPPRFLVDLPLASSVGVTEIGFGAFAETAGGIGSPRAALVPQSAIAVGLESTVVVTYLLDWPLTFGVAVRIDLNAPSLLSANDLRFYLDIELIESIGTIGDYLD